MPVIEDDRAIRELRSIVLAAEGYDIRVTASGGEGLVMADQWRPHVVLLELLMRDMDGWTFRAEQRRDGLADGCARTSQWGGPPWLSI